MPQDNLEIKKEEGLLEIKPEGFLPFTEPEIQAEGNPVELRDILGKIKTLTSAPTYIPKQFSQQLVVAVAGGVASLYVYDVSNQKWRASTLGT